MLRLIKQVFIALLSFSRPLVTKCVSLNNGSCMIRPTLIDLNPIDLKYYPCMISSDKFNGSCNSVDDLSTNICSPSKIKGINVKITNI